MTRFDAADPADRRKLVADAVQAHRERGSEFLTVQGAWNGGEETLADLGDDGDDGDGGDEEPDPWVQFGDRTFNLDVTDEELARLEALLNDYPEFRVEARESPETAEGTNVRITAKSDAGRLAAFVDDAFLRVYDAPKDYRLWVAAV